MNAEYSIRLLRAVRRVVAAGHALPPTALIASVAADLRIPADELREHVLQVLLAGEGARQWLREQHGLPRGAKRRGA